jgi:CheY-like chemotaxis protein
MKLLLVDDTEEVLNNLEEYLAMEGYEIETASNGLQALECLPKFQPDLIITDLLMPDMDGFELIREVRQQPIYQEIPIIVFSARPLDEGKDITDYGANVFLLKPSSVEILSDTIARFAKE